MIEICKICNSDYKKSLKTDHLKFVKHLEKQVNVHISDKSSHLSSNEHKNCNNKIWCEDCSKNITDKTRHFQSEIHLRTQQNNELNQQNTFSLDTHIGNGVERIMIEKTYIKFKTNPTENLEHQINDLLGKSYFPRFEYQLSY